MGNYLGKSGMDFSFDEIVPSAYQKYVDGLFDGAEIKVFQKPKNSDKWFDIQIRTANDKLLYGLQGNEGDSVVHLFYSSKNFMFNMIPFSREQQMVFTKLEFIKHFNKRLLDEVGINLDPSFLETRPIFNER
jgi:hypothetical protein